MAITANVVNGKLDYKYTDSSDKKAAKGSDLGYDQFLQLLCAEMQYQDPLEPTSNTDYVAQLATFSQLEATLEQTNTQQGSMANNLVGQEVILKVENENTGATNTVDGKVDYVSYQNGEIFLSVEGNLYPLSTLDTVVDSKYYDAVTLADSVSGMLAAFPDYQNLTSAYEGAVKELRTLLDDMSSYEKGFLKEDDLTRFKRIEERVTELVNAKKEAAQKAEDTVETV